MTEELAMVDGSVDGMDTAERAGLLQAYEDLKGACQKLAAAISVADRALPAEVYEITRAASGEGMEVRIEGDSAIARRHTAAIVARLKAEDEHEDLARVQRLPGVVVASEATRELARAVNTAKDRFKERYLAIAPERRREAIRRVVPGIHLKQAYRHIPVFDQAPRRVSFTWAAAEVHSESLSYADVARRIDELEARCARDRDPGSCRERIIRDRERLAKLGANTRFALIRPNPPHPRANLLFTERGHVSRRTVVTSLPLLVPPGPPGIEEAIVPLRNFDPTRVRARRIDRTRGELFLPPLSIYRRLP